MPPPRARFRCDSIAHRVAGSAGAFAGDAWAVCGRAAATAGDAFDQQSLALRTVLFHEPSLEQPLRSLVELYQKAGKVEELLGMYRGHVVQYPDDAGSNALLVRLLLELKRPEASAAAQAAVEAHPDHALTLYLRHLDLETQRDPRSLDFLSQAAEKEADPSRKRAWVEKLVAAAVAEDRRDLAEKPLRDLAAAPGQTAETLAALAQRMNRDRFFALALETLKTAAAQRPSPETAVEIDLQSATAEAGLGKAVEASARLEALLERVAPDYARRPEIVSRRVGLVKSDAEREAMLKSARAAFAASPKSEAAALDLAELLVACELRLEALKVLRQAGEALPQSERLERAALTLLDRLGDERGVRDFIFPRLAALPAGVERPDLAYRLVRALYALGARDEAGEKFETLLGKTGAPDRPDRRLDLARALRRMSLPSDAAAQFEKALAADPKRLDIRRELAESQLAAGDAAAARRLMREALDGDAEIENFLDAVAFMTQQNMLPEGRDALRGRLTREPRNFEVAMILVDVLARLGEQKDGEVLLDQSRLLADTEARYRRWLEAAQAFAETMDTTEAFFASEQARLVAEVDEKSGGWTKERAARYLTLCDVFRQSKSQPQLIAALKQRLEDASLPAGLRVPLHRLLVEALRRDPKNAVEVQNHLEQLAAEDTEHADEYRLRLARAAHEAMQQTGGRSDQVRALLQQTDPKTIDDAPLLRGTHRMFLDYGLEDKALAVLERLTELEPTDRGHWERWVTALAGLAEEERLREVLRRLLSGGIKTPLNEATLEMLRGHLVDSCWRSAAALIAANEPDRLPEILPLLGTIERTKKLGAEQLWVTWARGWTLRQLGRAEAASEAAIQIEALARQFVAPDQMPVRVLFPDGLSMAVDKAVALLRDPEAPMAWPAESAAGPATAPEMRWGFQTDGGAAVVQVQPFADGVFVLDEAATLYWLEAATGKIRWRADALWKAAPAAVPVWPRGGGRASRSGPGGGYTMNEVGQPVSVAPRFSLDPHGARLFLCREGRLTALSAKKGSLLWRAEIGGISQRPVAPPGLPPSVQLPDQVFLDSAERVVVWRPETATASAFHPESGKLLWTRELTTGTPNPALGPLNCGASCAGGLLLVYGQQPCVLETTGGATLWSFDASAVREFPLELKTDEDAAHPAASALPPAFSSGPGSGVNPSAMRALASGGLNATRRLAMNYLKPATERASVLSRWMESKGVLVAPAVAWAEQNWQPLGGEIVRGRLVLAMPGLVLAPSLALPLGGPRFDPGGTFVGATANRAIFQSNAFLQICDLARGTSVSVPLQQLGLGPTAVIPEAVVAGPRVFVTGEKGLLCLNPLTQRVLYFAPWPEKVRRFAKFDSTASTEGAAGGNPALLQGVQRSVQFTPRWHCTVHRHRPGLGPHPAPRGTGPRALRCPGHGQGGGALG